MFFFYVRPLLAEQYGKDFFNVWKRFLQALENCFKWKYKEVLFICP